MIDMIRTLEQELLQVLIDNVPADRRVETPQHTLLNGPQINPEGKADVVSDQSQVDDLLASLGF
jgi:chemotaxis protein CheZ